MSVLKMHWKYRGIGMGWIGGRYTGRPMQRCRCINIDTISHRIVPFSLIKTAFFCWLSYRLSPAIYSIVSPSNKLLQTFHRVIFSLSTILRAFFVVAACHAIHIFSAISIQQIFCSLIRSSALHKFCAYL